MILSDEELKELVQLRLNVLFENYRTRPCGEHACNRVGDQIKGVDEMWDALKERIQSFLDKQKIPRKGN
jgi:hypothetical protein